MIKTQDIFNAAWNHFIINEAPPAVDVEGSDGFNGGTCKYLTPDGRKCAIGLCLPDNHPSQKAKGNVSRLTKDYPDIEFEDIHEANMLQKFLHDWLVTRDQWSRSLEKRKAEYLRIAALYNLTVPN